MPMAKIPRAKPHHMLINKSVTAIENVDRWPKGIVVKLIIRAIIIIVKD